MVSGRVIVETIVEWSKNREIKKKKKLKWKWKWKPKSEPKGQANESEIGVKYRFDRNENEIVKGKLIETEIYELNFQEMRTKIERIDQEEKKRQQNNFRSLTLCRRSDRFLISWLKMIRQNWKLFEDIWTCFKLAAKWLRMWTFDENEVDDEVQSRDRRRV